MKILLYLEFFIDKNQGFFIHLICQVFTMYEGGGVESHSKYHECSYCSYSVLVSLVLNIDCCFSDEKWNTLNRQTEKSEYWAQGWCVTFLLNHCSDPLLLSSQSWICLALSVDNHRSFFLVIATSINRKIDFEIPRKTQSALDWLSGRVRQQWEWSKNTCVRVSEEAERDSRLKVLRKTEIA